jgi:hypothetical protein
MPWEAPGLKGGSAPAWEDATTVAGLLRFQSEACRWVGSPLYEALLARAAADHDAGGPTRPLLEGHEGDPKDSALALRMMGAVHRLVLEGRAPALAERYRAGDGDHDRTWGAFRATIEERLVELRPLLERPVQTNEVGRCAALLPGFLGVAAETGLPLRLLEVGASAGLNLFWSEYRYEGGDFAWGSAGSPVRIPFELSGGEIDPVAAVVAERSACDAAPVDPCSQEGRLTLLSYVWPDQTDRMERLRAALELAALRPAAVERSGAVEWAAELLAVPAPGRATVLFHSVVMQYLSADEREAFSAVVREAGARASDEAPLAWLRMEPDGERAAVRMATWPGGGDRLLGRAGYHGTPVELSG